MKKYTYITYGQPNPKYSELEASERMKIISEAREKAKEMGFKLDVFGSPYGTTEGMVVIWKSNKHLDKFTVNSLIPFWYETRTVSVRNIG